MSLLVFRLGLIAALVLGAAAPLSAQTFQLLGDDLRVPTALSADGRVVAGVGGSPQILPFRWEGGAFEFLDLYQGRSWSPSGISGEGEIITGLAGTLPNEPFTWQDGTFSVLPLHQSGYNEGYTVTGITHDGQIITGNYRGESDGFPVTLPLKWVDGNAVVLSPSDGDVSAGTAPHGVSADGSVIVGSSDPRDGSGSKVARWLGGATAPEVFTIPGWPGDNTASRLSSDGSTLSVYVFRDGSPSSTEILVGLWRDGALTELGTWFESSLPAEDTFPRYDILDMNADGSIVIGTRENGPPAFDRTAVIWDAVNGWRDLQDVFVAAGLNLQGLTRFERGGFISDDGTVIVGSADSGPGTPIQAYRAVLVPTETDLIVNDDRDASDADLSDDVCDVDLSEGGNQCTLRAAIETSNRRPGARNAITFDLDGPGPHTIAVPTDFEPITVPIVLDATTQPGYDGTPVVSLQGNGNIGLSLVAGNSVVRGLAIGGFNTAIFLPSQPGNVVEACHIGVNAAGTGANPNEIGITISASSGHRIGGKQPAQRNVISGNSVVGLSMLGEGASNVVIEGNHIGTNAAGTEALPNANGGLFLDGTANVTIGGSASGAGNVISGNAGAGVTVVGTATSGLVVSANTIGLNAAGTAALPNEGEGIRVLNAPDVRIGGSASGARNLISGNATHGVRVEGPEASGVVIAGNWIGLAADGRTPIPNGTDDTRQAGHHGVYVLSAPEATIGGASATPGSAPGNVIAGNAAHEIYATGTPEAPATGLRILGNLLGTDRTGATAVISAHETVLLAGAAPNAQIGAEGAGNVVVAGAEGEGNSRGGIALLGLSATAGAPDGATVAGNLVGLNASGSAPLGRIGTGVSVVSEDPERGVEGVTIGGEAGNCIVGVLGIGVLGPRSSGTVVEGNTVGLLASGALAREERETIGLLTFLANEIQILDNTIGGQAIGIAIASDDNTLLRNRIGTDPTGTQARPNTRGVIVYGEIDGGLPVGDRNQIGAEGAGNVISGNGRGGLGIGGVFDLPDEGVLGAIPDGPRRADALGLRDVGLVRDTRKDARAGDRGPDENLIAFNFIGTNASGTAQLGNGRGPTVDESFAGVGIQDGRANQLIGNVISGNGGGVVVRFDDEEGGDPRETLVAGNVIGGSANGTLSIPNQYGGVFLAASPGNRLDAAVLTENGAPVPNLVRSNGERGVIVLTFEDETGNQIRGTSFVGNEGPSIELIDGEGGYPSVAAPVPQVFWATSADEGGATLRLRSDVAGEVDLFASTSCAGGNAEGRILGFSEVTAGVTSLAVPDLLPDLSPLAQYLAVTLTPPGPAATTSAFSDCVRIARPDDVAEVPVAPGETGEVFEDLDLQISVTENGAPLAKGGGGGTLYVSRYGEQIVPQPGPFGGSATASGGTAVTPDAVSSNRHWTLRAEGLGDVTYSVCLEASGVGGIQDISQVLVLHRVDSGEPWTPYDTALDGTRLCASGLTAWGDLGIGGDSQVNPVPSEPEPLAPEALAVRAFPNPASGAMTVEVAMPEAAPVRVVVADLLGRVVAVLHEGPLAAGVHPFVVQTGSFAPGVYVLRASTPEATATHRALVVR